MRPAIRAAALLALAATAPEFIRSVLACGSSVVFESLPYLTASALLAPWLGRHGRTMVTYAGCGCGDGPAARSVPAAIAAAWLFGPWVALARWGAAVVLSRLVTAKHRCHGRSEETLLDAVATLVPSAALCGVVVTLAPALSLGGRPWPLQVLAGLVLGVTGAPCSLGAVALAGALHAQSPLACAGVLCVAGIVPPLFRPVARGQSGRAAFVLLACATAILAFEHGAGLVHPRLTIWLWCTSTALVILGARARGTIHRGDVVIASLLIVATVLGSQPPPYFATETTLERIFPGEEVSFTGAYVSRSGSYALMRYAITCCRADAQPVTVALSGRLPLHENSWVRVRGLIERTGNALVLDPIHVRPLAPPRDPFIYR